MFVKIINSFGSPDHWHSLQHIRAACAGTELLVELILDIHVNNLGTLFVRGPRFPSASTFQLTCAGLLNRPTRWPKDAHI